MYYVGAQFHSDFISRVGIPVAMGLFIDCHFLFEVQLLCLSMHIEVLSFENSEWSRGMPSVELGTFPTYSSLVRAQPLLSFPYVSIKTPFLVTRTIQDRNIRCTSRANR